MKFVLQLVPITPDKAILNSEAPLKGAKFLEEAGACLRRSVDNVGSSRHVTMGALNTYAITVPQSIALESGQFTDTDKVFLPVEDGFLDVFIFHGATISNVPGNKRVYPYYADTVTLVSYIDELAVLDMWRERGYPNILMKNVAPPTPSQNFPPIVRDPEEDIRDPALGDVVLDDLEH